MAFLRSLKMPIPDALYRCGSWEDIELYNLPGSIIQEAWETLGYPANQLFFKCVDQAATRSDREFIGPRILEVV